MHTTSSSSDESSGNVSEESTDESSCGSTDGEEIHSKIVSKHVGEARVANKTRRRKIRNEEEARVSTERIKRRVRFIHDDAHSKKTK
jgi:predicted ATPase with chaperone activity